MYFPGIEVCNHFFFTAYEIFSNFKLLHFMAFLEGKKTFFQGEIQ